MTKEYSQRRITVSKTKLLENESRDEKYKKEVHATAQNTIHMNENTETKKQ